MGRGPAIPKQNTGTDHPIEERAKLDANGKSLLQKPEGEKRALSAEESW